MAHMTKTARELGAPLLERIEGASYIILYRTSLYCSALYYIILYYTIGFQY